MKETGQMDRILKKWQAKPRSDCGGDGEYVSMGIENTISAFAFMALAIIIAIFIFIIEFSFEKWIVRKNHVTKEESKNYNYNENSIVTSFQN